MELTIHHPQTRGSTDFAATPGFICSPPNFRLCKHDLPGIDERREISTGTSIQVTVLHIFRTCIQVRNMGDDILLISKEFVQ